jgi:hypothetical protein
MSASTPEGNYAYTYEDDPELMRLGGLGLLGGGTGTAAGQSILSRGPQISPVVGIQNSPPSVD